MNATRPAGLAASSLSRLLTGLAIFYLCALPAAGQTPATVEFGDRRGALEKLAREILKAQSHGDTKQTEELLNGLLLSDPLAWYSSVFDEKTATLLARGYEAHRAAYPKELEEFFATSQQEHFTDAQAMRYESSCDDASGDQTFGVLFARDVPVPLYELRLMKGRAFRKLWALAYVDGAFRFVGVLSAPQRLVEVGQKGEPRDAGSKSGQTNRVLVSKQVQEARLIQKVQPVYPEVARKEHLEGTVHIHAIIGTDGTMRALQVLGGSCSLAESAVAAVRRWRYSPTEVAGKKVEVETYIDVVYQLTR